MMKLSIVRNTYAVDSSTHPHKVDFMAYGLQRYPPPA